ncbi:PilZ domain-containing protein [Desulfobotulus sp.]|jgi:hypothetical protein|uniref:PilZ domain-containing protein n=1 Tax=Desulfobotulus sp. TaxID=1940337 RepID=UPI002A35FFCD|nr:PilZ domain-containing protein [Desulfobotulus sp.]MDY0161799.1 PilZ domain-containing protein [Desulfobotulus sp.]
MTHDQGISEKRRFPFRPETRNLVHFSVLGENGRILNQGMGKTLNISRGGLLLEAHSPIPEESRVQLSIGMGDEILDLEVIIVHARPVKEKLWQAGMAFLPMTGPKARLLSLFIERFEMEMDT